MATPPPPLRAPLRALLALLTLMSLTHTLRATPEARAEGGGLRVAVMELRNGADLNERQTSALTAQVRASVAAKLGGGYSVMSREGIMAMASDQPCDAAREGGCKEGAGRALKAHFIVLGALRRLGSALEVSLRLYDNRSSQYLGARECVGRDAEELTGELKKTSEALAGLIKRPGRGAGAKARRAQSERRASASPGGDLAERTVHDIAVWMEWLKLQRALAEGGAGARRATEGFLARFEGHPFGNPLEPEARAALERLARGEAPAPVARRLPAPAAAPAAAPVAAAGVEVDRRSGVEWVEVPEGSFEMGSGSGDEGPARTVRLRAFLMSKTEVTVGQYRRCVAAGACAAPSGCAAGASTWSAAPGGREDHPVNCVDWGQARTFARWVGADLPTEAEWEYAARGGQGFAYAGSGSPDEVAWHRANSGGAPRPVGARRPNGYGLYDMSGNVWEWTLDRYKEHYRGAPRNGHKAVGPVPKCKGRCEAGATGRVERVERGGAWSYGADSLRVAYRGSASPDGRFADLGVRLSKRLR